MQADRRRGLIEAALREIEQHYVFPDRASTIAAAIRARRESGAYESAEDLESLGMVVTRDLQSESGDLHLVLEPAPEGMEAEELERMVAGGYGITSVRRHSGNVGVLTLRYFAPAWRSGAGRAMNAAMSLLVDRDAMIIDLRRARGGDPGMIALVSTYFFDEADGLRHLNDMHHRDGRVQQWWTLPWLPGPRPGSSIPLCLLTSRQTFSGAEEFAWNLRALGRAVIIGEQTAGAAHPSRAHRIEGGLRVHVPYARSINPHNGENWEGRGIEPDHHVSADEALESALRQLSSAAH